MKELPITEFDMQTLPQFIQLAKAILPFMEFNTQQTLSPLLRAYEFSCTMNYYSRPESLRIAACSAKPHLSLNSPIQDILSDENIMNVILTYCPDNLRNILSNFKNYNKMSDLFNILNRDQNGSNSFLNPEMCIRDRNIVGARILNGIASPGSPPPYITFSINAVSYTHLIKEVLCDLPDYSYAFNAFLASSVISL